MPTPPPSAKELKQRLLRQAVQDNLSTRAGHSGGPRAASGPASRTAAGRTASTTARRDGRRTALLWGGALLVLAATATSLILLPGSTATRAEIGVLVPAAPTEGAPAPEPIFTAPTPIDTGVLGLAVRRIVIDPGHGGEDTGTTGSGLTEKDLTLDIAERLRERLLHQGFEVHLTRHDDRDITLRERTRFANQLRADLFVSIHINWIVERTVRGLETYYLGATDDPELSALAQRENRDSGYSLADMRSLLESMYTGVRQDESRQLAQAVQGSLYKGLLRQNPELKNRGVKSAPFVVLVATEMPAILAEVSCLSNEQEAELLARPLYRDHIADALSRGIRRYADEVNQSEAKGS